MKDQLAAEIDAGVVVEAPLAITRLMKIQQVTGGFLRDTETGTTHRVPSNRAQAVVDFVEEAQGKVVVWARFQEEIDLLQEALAAYSPAVFDGRTSEAGRVEAKRRFQEDDACQVFIGNQAAAGTGLDGLQRVARTMIYYSNTFNAGDRWQSEARLFRSGQQGAVVVADLVSPGTIDAKVLQVLAQRRSLADSTVDDVRTMLREIAKE